MKLNVNIDHVATLREARGGVEPDPIRAARAVERAGAHGITFHLREDRRHIQDEDVRRLRQTARVKLNMEMAATPEMIRLAERIRPDWVTLVPEKRRELTTEGGLDVIRSRAAVIRALHRLGRKGIVVGVFIDPDPRQILATWRAGVSMIEIHTGPYADARSAVARRRLLRQVQEGVRLAETLGLRVNAGHGLNYTNVRPIARVRGIQELSIGHSIVSRALDVGFERAVREMLTLINQGAKKAK